MNKTMILTSLILFASQGFAASSGSLILRGTVNAVNDIVVNPNGQNLALNIMAGETNKLVGSASETSNNLAGYKIFVSSPNNGELRNTSDATRKTSYQLSYNGQTAISLNSNGTQVKNVNILNGLTTANSDIRVNVTAFPTAPAGVYEDTVTISIQAN